MVAVLCFEFLIELNSIYFYLITITISHFTSAVHKATGLTAPGRSISLTGTIPGTMTLAVNGSCWQECFLKSIPAGDKQSGRLMNSAVNHWLFTSKG